MIRLSSGTIRLIIPAVSLALLLVAVFYMQPRAMSYTGLNLLFNLAVPIALATVAQMLIMAVNDLDLSMGTFVSFTACVAATLLQTSPLVGVLILAAAIAVYAAIGVVIYVRDIPSIVVTLGMSFVWGGLAVLLLPSPGGNAPDWARWLMTSKPPFVPMAIVASVVIAVITQVIMRSSFGVLIRGVGGNFRSVERAGWSVIAIRAGTFALAGFFAVLSGIALVGLTTSADANIALRYTLLSIAGVILGGGEFVGGRVSADRCRDRRADTDAGRILPFLHAYLAGLADRRTRRDPDCRSGSSARPKPA